MLSLHEYALVLVGTLQDLSIVKKIKRSLDRRTIGKRLSGMQSRLTTVLAHITCLHVTPIQLFLSIY